jgi:hypothetical protein
MAIIPEDEQNSVVAIFALRSTAKSAIEELKKAGFDSRKLMIVDRGEG